MHQPNTFATPSPESAELFHLIVENVTGYAIFMTDAEGIVISWNPGVERLLGYVESEIVGEPIAVIFTPEDRAAGVDVLEMETAKQTGRSEDKRWHLRKDGSKFWVNGKVMPIKNDDGTLRGFAKVMRDDTAQKLAEEKLAEANRHTESILSSITDAFYTFDRDLRYVYVNEATTRMFKLPEASFLGKTLFDLFPDVEGNIFHREIKLALKEQEPRVFENYYPPFDRWFENRIYPTPNGLSVFTAEITVRKRVEQKWRLLTNLNLALQTLVDPNEIMARTARMLGEFLGANRCAYAEVEADEDSFRITGDYTSETFSIVGEFRMSAFGAEALQLMRKNKPYVVNDTEADTRTAANLEIYRQTGIRAVVSVPLHKNGRFAAGMAVHQNQPRVWTRDEIELIEMVVNRCWESIERARTVKNLRESEARFRNMADNAPVMIWITDADANCSYLSQSWYKFTGQTAETASGLGWLDAVHPDDGERTGKIFLEANEKREPFRLEYRLRRADGEYRWAIDSAQPRFSDASEFLGYIGSVIDISERKRVEENLRESEEKYRTLFNSIDEGYCIIEVLFDEREKPFDYRFVQINSAFERQTGLTDAIGKTMREFAPEMENYWFDIYGKVAATGEAVRFESEAAELHRWYDVYAFRYGEPKERLVAVLFNDITQRKSAESEREILLAREQELRQTAEMANRLKDEFLATLSHELRTPLNAILGWTQMLQSRSLGESESVKALATIERSARSQNQLIEDILDVSRIITGKLRLDVRAVDLPSVISSAADVARPAAEAKNIRLQVLLDPSATPISGDPDRLQQVVWNLLSNAVKFTPKGGRVQIRLERVNSHVEITVSDTGKGIKDEFLPHVFDRFRQSDGSMTRRHGGLGLGLAIVRQIVELHGGTVEVMSDGEDKGATFIISLPLLPVRKEVASSAMTPRVHPTAQSGTKTETGLDCLPEFDGLRVLVVDDEADSRDLLYLILNSCGAEVTTANSAAEAFATIKKQKFDILISDIGMPGEDGFSLIGRIRELTNEEGGSVPAIALTAYARSEDRVRAIRSGFQIHIAKPVESAELVAVVANLSGRTKKTNQNRQA